MTRVILVCPTLPQDRKTQLRERLEELKFHVLERNADERYRWIADRDMVVLTPDQSGLSRAAYTQADCVAEVAVGGFTGRLVFTVMRGFGCSKGLALTERTFFQHVEDELETFQEGV